MARRVVRVLLGIVIGLVVAVVAGLYILKSEWAAARVQREAIEFLEARFDAEVELEAISLQLVPRVAVSGRGLTLTRVGESEPFVTMRQFEIAGTPMALFRRRVQQIDVDGLDLRVERGRPRAGPTAAAKHLKDVYIDAIHVANGQLLIVPNNPKKLPLDFTLHDVTVTGFGFDRASAYSAVITNPKPESVIQSEGEIGPWDPLALRTTPLKGVYLLKDGKMNTIKGLGGRLTSSGSFEGILERINVQGTTSIPDFQLTLARQAVPLETRYTATVDGTTGDTYLHDVQAKLGR